MNKVVVIGANHAGLAAINVMTNSDIEHKITVFDKNSDLSYLGCGTSLVLGKQVESLQQLFYTSKDAYETKNTKFHTDCDVQKIDFQHKLVYGKNKDNEEIIEQYDQLVLATGSFPKKLDVVGSELGNIFNVMLFNDCKEVNAILEEETVENVIIVGAGLIGIELAEAIHRRGKKVTVFESKETCLSSYFDPWVSQEVDRCLSDNDIGVHYSEKVVEFSGTDRVQKVKTNKGTYLADLVIVAIGFQPNTKLGENRGLLSESGAYQVNKRQETVLPGVYAIGDCATIYNNALEQDTYLPRVSNAVRSGIIAGSNICGVDVESLGVQGTTGISVFGYNMVETGLTVKQAKKAGFKTQYSDFEDFQKPLFMKNNQKVKIRIVYDEETRRVLGAQLASYQDISMGIHFFSLAIEEKVTIDKLKLTDIFFLPQFNQPYNYITMAALSSE